MTYLKIIITSIVLYILLLQINLKMLEKRIDFLVENIDKYYQQYGSYPNNFDFISTKLILPLNHIVIFGIKILQDMVIVTS